MRLDKVNRNLSISELFDKSTMEVAWQGVPLTSEINPDSPKETLVLFDRERCDKCYQVKDGEIYTIRLGIHGNPNRIGTISRDSSVVCAIPTKSGKQLNVTAIFSIAEIYPAVVMDRAYLNADTTFHLEYVYRSAALERNTGSSRGLVLSDDSVRLQDDAILVGHYCLEGEIPDYCTYTYDFIAVQVRAVFDDESVRDEIANSN